MAQAAARKRASPSPAGYSRGRTENLLPPLRVSYYRQMHRQRVYQVTVSWQKSSDVRPPSGTEPIRVRLLMAGAQIVPSEQVLDPADPDASTSFYVTPLADGRLRGEHLEVLMQGRKVQEVLLPAKVVSQRITWMLFALTFMMPWFILNYLRPREAGETFPFVASEIKLPAYITSYVPDLPKMLAEGSLYSTALWRELHAQTKAHPLEVYWFLGFLLITLVSWWSHRSKRKRRVGQPIPLPRPAED